MKRVFYAFGTMNYMQVEDDFAEEILDQMVRIALELDDLLSVFKPNSEISKINSNAGLRPVKVSRFTLKLIERALHFSEISEGAFDITIRPVVKLWGIGHKEQHIPTDLELNKIQKLVDYKLLDINSESCSVYLRKRDQSIDLGGIAKGYAGDLIRQKLLEAGIHNGILNFGGTILTIGKKTNGSSWRVGIQNPLNIRGQSVGTINLNDAALVTSGMNERYFIKDGMKYHHIINPRTLKPSRSNALSVTATGSCAMDLDALTTAFFVMGIAKGIALANTLGVEVLYLLNNGGMYATNGFINKELNFQFNDENKKNTRKIRS